MGQLCQVEQCPVPSSSRAQPKEWVVSEEGFLLCLMGVVVSVLMEVGLRRVGERVLCVREEGSCGGEEGEPS